MHGGRITKRSLTSIEAETYDQRWSAGMLLTAHNANLSARGYGHSFREQLVADAVCAYGAQYLEGLAATQAEAIDQLRVRGITGTRLSSLHCVISELLYKVFREPFLTNAYILRVKRGSAWAQVPLPQLWIVVADGFDRGYYPDLITPTGKETK